MQKRIAMTIWEASPFQLEAMIVD